MKFFKNKFFKIIFVVLFILIILVAISIATGKNILIDKMLGVFATPVQTATENIGDTALSTWDRFFKYPEVLSENKELKNKISELEKSTNENSGLLEENIELKSLLKFKDSSPELTLKAGSIISRGSNEWDKSVVINIGSMDGAKKGNIVITDIGLVGVISEVLINSSKVTTILDPDCVIGAMNIRSREPSILKGDLELASDGLCRLNLFDSRSDFQVSDIITTSGLGETSPKDINIGTVSEISSNTDGISKYAKIVPSVDIKKARNIFVVTDFKEKKSEN